MAGTVGLGLLCDHVGFRVIVGTVSLGVPGGLVGSRGKSEAVGLVLPGRHVGSRAIAEGVGLGQPAAMLFPGAWQELNKRVCRWPCWFPAHGGSCGPEAAARHVGSHVMAGAV